MLTFSQEQQFLGAELTNEAPNTPETARFQVLPVPMECSVSYAGGTAAGPEAIIEASHQLESWDGKGFPANAGIYTWPAVECTGNAEQDLAAIKAATSIILRSHEEALPIVLGGEHTVSLGVLQALAEKHGRFGIVHIDAHADLRESYEGNFLSHACVMHRAVAGLGLSLVQFGVRALCHEEQQFRDANKALITCYDAEALHCSGVKNITLPANFPDKVYISFDVDGLDPAIMPATGTPVPGGLLWYDALDCVAQSIKRRTVIGCDVVEFAPIPALHHASFTAARLVYALMGLIDNN